MARHAAAAQDLFYSALAQNSQALGIAKHRRVHFNTAMLEVGVHHLSAATQCRPSAAKHQGRAVHSKTLLHAQGW